MANTGRSIRTAAAFPHNFFLLQVLWKLYRIFFNAARQPGTLSSATWHSCAQFCAGLGQIASHSALTNFVCSTSGFHRQEQLSKLKHCFISSRIFALQMVDKIHPDFPGSQAVVTQSFQSHAAHIATRVDFLANPLIARTVRSCWAKTHKSLVWKPFATRVQTVSFL